MKKITRVALITSGGDCQGLNAAMRGIGKALHNKVENLEIFGMYDGYRGLVDGDYKFMEPKDFAGILTQGGTILGTSRQRYIPGKDIIDENGNSLIPAMKDTYNRLNLDCLVIMGGNGTQKSAKLLMDAGMNVVTLPKTIDNDIWGTDTTFGFQSAVDVATNVIDYIHSTASSHSRVFVVELMGRDAGWLTLHAGIGSGADIILIPEIPYDINAILKAVDHRRRHGRSGQQGAKTGLFGWEALQRIAEAARQQGICPAEEYQREACPAGPQRKADTSQHQRPAPGQKCRAEPAGPEPSGGHGRPHGAEQAEAVQ